MKENMSLTAPFMNGNLLRSARWRQGTPGFEWRDNRPFRARLTLLRKREGSSSSHFVFADEDGHTYPMHAEDLVQLLKATGTINVDGPWIIGRRGPAYGIRYAGKATGDGNE